MDRGSLARTGARRRVATCTVSLVAAALLAGQAAHADGDPASDWLYTQRVFVPQDARLSASAHAQLSGLVEQAFRAGYPIKVALIASAFDLGADPELWRKPALYARFLGQELTYLYRGRLLIVMPNGFGLSRDGHADPREVRRLDGLTVERGAGGLDQSALAAIERLAGGAGHPLEAPPAAASSPRRSELLGVGIGTLLVLGAIVVALRRRRRGN